MDTTRLHKWVADYNWDDGLAPMWPIAESQRTEFATAILIYWRLGGPALEANTSPLHAEAKQLQAQVRAHLLEGFYPLGPSHFAPDLSRVQLYQFRREGVPEILLNAPPSPNNTY